MVGGKQNYQKLQTQGHGSKSKNFSFPNVVVGKHLISG